MAENADYAEIVSKITQLVEKHSNISDVELETRLYHDLKLDGDDASELIDEINDVYHIDASGINFNNHFNSELPFNPLVFVVIWLFFSGKLNKKKDAYKKIPLTVNDLVETVSIGHWSTLINQREAI